jgi:hypothetical protein
VWFLGWAGTSLGLGLIFYGLLRMHRGQHARGRWGLSRGSVVLVIGMGGFLSSSAAAGVTNVDSIASVMVSATAVAILLVLMLAEETAYEGATMTEFTTRPARGPSTPLKPREDRFAAGRPVPSANRPDAESEVAEKEEEEAPEQVEA